MSWQLMASFVCVLRAFWPKPQAPVLLRIFRPNATFNGTSQCTCSWHIRPIRTKFCTRHHCRARAEFFLSSVEHILNFLFLNKWYQIHCWGSIKNNKLFFAATKQLYEWFSPSVRLSVGLSVCLSVTPFWLCSHHRIIMKFSGVITTDQGKVHAKGQCQRSKVKVTEVTTQLNRFRTVTPVWIHIWWWNDIYSLMLIKRGALLFFKVIRQISRSHGSKHCRIWPRLGVSGL